ncbi:phytanoyl-CoA dioxygenase family protein [Nitrosomonas sp. Nm166]|uniref:phytanoyl-CoA dioxygenase family protein n=1 Tax=Nitrosomonas sp. Nm166 TaxID=1881054 RepID=UPI0008EAC3E8|nr:phytanoyl-CoA dioxygenase family protein [Nitrosomonas sp. Nm166]SFE12127.1 Ectoine hydroxylase-related dioxygenase, phytanoyl-CoA dioxygenase (PhyH) family [Nitrosomonas sp. Nm166]
MNSVLQISPDESSIDIEALPVTRTEVEQGALSDENIQLGALLLNCRGYVILRQILSPSLNAALHDSMDELVKDCIETWGDQTPQLGQGQKILKSHQFGVLFWERGSRLKMFPRLVGPFADPAILANSLVLPILRAAFGSSFYCKSVASDVCMKGAMLQAPHRDLVHYSSGPSGYIVNIATVHSHRDNGPLEIWPGGSQFWHKGIFLNMGLNVRVQDARNPPVDKLASFIDSKYVELWPGDVLIRDPGMWHRGTPNNSGVPRPMLTIGYYKRGFSCHYGDPGYNASPKEMRKLAPSIQSLFRYSYDWRDPLFWKLQIERMQKRRKGTV